MHTQTGHRQRVRDRFLSEGLDSFDEVHVLELLLFYAIPQRDTKPLARALLDHFGSLSLVLDASQEELMAVKGVGEGIATFLRLIPAAGRYYQTHREQAAAILNTTENAVITFWPSISAARWKPCFCCVWIPSVSCSTALWWEKGM